MIFAKQISNFSNFYLRNRYREQIYGCQGVRRVRGTGKLGLTYIHYWYYVENGLTIENLEKAMATHSSTLAWKIPWMEEPGALQSMGSWRVGHDWATSLSLFTFMHWRRKWPPTPVFLPGESEGREPGGLPSMGLHRVGHDWSDLAALITYCIAQGTLLNALCWPEWEGNPKGRGYIYMNG